MQPSLALLEFSSVAAGVLAVDRMLKRSPVALLRCGTVHPGRYLALVGGTVAATEEAHAEGRAAGAAALVDDVCLADPHPALAAAVAGVRVPPSGEAVGVIELASSPAMLRALDAALKAVPVGLVEVRLADDLGGRALAVVDGALPDVAQALDTATERAGGQTAVLGRSLMARVDDTLRRALGESSRFATCPVFEPAGAERLAEEPCTSAG